MSNTEKLFHIDVETTGTDAKENGLVQLAGIIEIDGDIKEKVDLLTCPFPNDTIEQSALDVIGKTEEEIKSYEDPQPIYRELISMMDHYVDRYNSSDKFHFIGYNSRFDESFIREWFRRLNDPYFGSWFYWPAIDASNLAAVELSDVRHTMPNFKLMTVAKELGISVDEDKAHDAFFDIVITRKIYKNLALVV